ncbi:MAG: hypothetical protein GY801_31690, partial [bacterium]|nr:hypothetical protein [bacterium]
MNTEERKAAFVNIRESLADILGTVLGLQREDLEETVTFKKLGIGSLNAVELLEAINIRFNLNLPTSIIFECHNVDALTIYIRERLDEIQKGISEESQNESTPASSRTGRASPLKSPYLSAKRGETVCESNTSADIAIIGLSCRCAGANGPADFWKLVSQRKECTREITHSDWLDFFTCHSPKKIPAYRGAMEGIDAFDALFFNISPKEAGSMDVAQRIVLEESYTALEDAGYTASLLRGQRVGTVIGTMGSSIMAQDFSHFSMLGSDTSILAARIAYYLDLKGPALAINTACSSSLVAIDLACQQLQHHEIDLAIAGGITVYTHPGAFVAMHNAGMLSPTGRCRPFDHAADGIVVGDGVGIVILKRLEDAERDQDHIYGIIRGSGTNQDGRTSGITAPSFLSQSQLAESIYRKYHICVEDLQYIEAHGTATKLGDPIEIHALTHAFQKFTSKTGFCALGSVKANIGHTTAAAGVLGVIKVLLSLKHRQIPPSINFDTANEHIDFEKSPVYVNTALAPWPLNSARSRLTAVSSFGFSGTNAHIVIEEYIPPKRDKQSKVAPAKSQQTQLPFLILLSAADENRLLEQVQQLFTCIQERQFSDRDLPDIAYTLQVGREAMEERLAMLVTSVEELEEKLKRFANGGDDLQQVYRGQVKSDKEALAIFRVDEDMTKAIAATIDVWMSKGKYAKLLDLWVKGLIVDWNRLYGDLKPGRISLPTYPFARERYWIPETRAASLDREVSSVSIVSAASSTETISPDIPGKPGEISLPSLSEQRIMPQPSGAQSAQAIRLDAVETHAQAEISTEKLQQELTTSLSKVLYMQRDDIDPDEQFIDMGMDSILGVEWIQVLNKQYGMSISATTIYDYPNIIKLTAFLAQELPATRQINLEQSRKEIPIKTESAPSQSAPLPSAQLPQLRDNVFSDDADSSIAVIGMSGQFPQARTLAEFWDNLAHGRDCISEIPAERWSIPRYYHPDPQ